MSNANFYEILGLDRNKTPPPTEKEIRRAYLKYSLKYHPDKNPNDPDGAKQNFIDIGRAYEILSDTTKRAAYDRELAFGKNGSASWKAFFGNQDGATGTDSMYSNESYDSYSAAFDAAVSKVSPEELNAIAGTAAVIGGIVGSLVGSHLLSKNNGGKSSMLKSALGTAGSMMGSAAGSEMAAGLVKSMHSRSVENATYEERRRVAQERGEKLPEKPRGWSDIASPFMQAAEAMSGNKNNTNASSHNDATSQKNNKSADSAFGGQNFFGVASAVMASVAEMKNTAKNQQR